MASHDLLIWHTFFGADGSNNGIHIFNQKTMYQRTNEANSSTSIQSKHELVPCIRLSCKQNIPRVSCVCVNNPACHQPGKVICIERGQEKGLNENLMSCIVSFVFRSNQLACIYDRGDNSRKLCQLNLHHISQYDS